MTTKEKDQKKADIVYNRYKKCKTLCEPVFERVEINRNLYKGYLETDDQYEWDYSLVDNQVFPLIRNYISRSNPSMTKVRLEARKSEDFEKREVNQDFVNWEIGELNTTQLFVRAFFSNYVAGRAYFKSGWKYDPRVVVKNGELEYEMRPLINRADLKFVQFNRILIPNRNIPSIMDQPYVLELLQLNVGEMLKENETDPDGEFWDKKFLANLKKNGVTSKMLDYEAESATDADTLDDITFRAATFPAVAMHTQDGEIFYIPLVGDTHQIINKNRENPYWHGHYPFIEMVAFPEDDEYFSMSVIDAVGDMGIAGTEVLNQLLTNIRSLNNNMWISGASEASTPDYMFKQRPSGIIRVAGDPNAIVPVRPNDGTSSMLRVGQEISTKFERTGGISSLYSSGAQDQNINQTARGAQLIDKNIENNVKMIMDLFGEQVLKRFGNDCCELNAQYVTEEQTFAVTGKRNVRSLITIKPTQVSANFDVYTYPEAMIKQTPASRQASLQNTITTLQTIELQSKGAVQIDVTPVVEALMDATPEMENVEDVIVALDEKAKRDFSMLERGQMPEIKVRDPHKDLIMAITIKYEEAGANYSPDVDEIFQKYVEDHIKYIQAAQEVNQMVNPPQPQLPAGGQMSPEQMATAGGGVVPDNMGTGAKAPYNLGPIVAGAQ